MNCFFLTYTLYRTVWESEVSCIPSRWKSVFFFLNEECCQWNIICTSNFMASIPSLCGLVKHLITKWSFPKKWFFYKSFRRTVTFEVLEYTGIKSQSEINFLFIRLYIIVIQLVEWQSISFNRRWKKLRKFILCKINTSYVEEKEHLKCYFI